jgi:hypothetical protein
MSTIFHIMASEVSSVEAVKSMLFSIISLLRNIKLSSNTSERNPSAPTIITSSPKFSTIKPLKVRAFHVEGVSTLLIDVARENALLKRYFYS